MSLIDTRSIYTRLAQTRFPMLCVCCCYYLNFDRFVISQSWFYSNHLLTTLRVCVGVELPEKTLGIVKLTRSIKYPYFLSFTVACCIYWVLKRVSEIFLVLLFPRPQRFPRGFDPFYQGFLLLTEASGDEGPGPQRMSNKGWTCRTHAFLFWEGEWFRELLTLEAKSRDLQAEWTPRFDLIWKSHILLGNDIKNYNINSVFFSSWMKFNNKHRLFSSRRKKILYGLMNLFISFLAVGHLSKDTFPI